jgi:hypothetical protein
MNDWIKQHSWPLIIAGATMVSTYSLYGYRITALEEQVDANSTSISQLRESGAETQVLLAEIKKDIEYIKLQVSRYPN